MSASPVDQGNDFSLTLARGIGVLELFSPVARTLTTSEVAQRLDVSRAAARRFLLTLTKLGYLEQTKANFSLTGKTTTIGQGELARQQHWAGAMSDVLELSGRLNESVSISVLDGPDIRFVARDPRRRMFSSYLAIGDRLPAHCSAAGKVLLASLSSDHLDDLLSASVPLQRRTAQTITDPHELSQELKRVRIQSWAVAEDEMETGTISIAVPIFGRNNCVTAALATATHRMRRSVDELHAEFLPVMLDAAERIGERVRKSQTAI